DDSKRTKLDRIFELNEFCFGLISRVVTQFVDNVFSCGKDLRKVCLQRSEDPQSKISTTCANFDDRPMPGRAQIEIGFREIVREGRRKQWTCFRRCPVISSAPLANFSWPVVITITLVIERRLHPIMKRHWTSEVNSFAQSIS